MVDKVTFFLIGMAAGIALTAIGLTLSCATEHPRAVKEAPTTREESILTINRLRHQIHGDRLYPENWPCTVHTNCTDR